MNRLQQFDGYGEFYAAFHERKAVFIHYQFDMLRIGDFLTLQELARATFKLPIVSILVPYADPKHPLRFVVVTEDGFAHLIALHKGKFKILVSSELGHGTMLSHALLLDNQSQCHLFFENGHLLCLARKESASKELEWPPDDVLKVVRMCATAPFEGQRSVAPNSASFVAFVRTEASPAITSWIVDFDSDSVFPGPFSIQVSPQSQFISSRFFGQNGELFNIYPFMKIGNYTDAVACSNFAGNLALFSDGEGEIMSMTPQDITKLTTLTDAPVRVETNGADFIYMRADGTLVAPSSGETFKIPAPFRLTEYNSIMVRCGLPSVVPFPTVQNPPPQLPNSTVEANMVSSNAGASWEPPYGIVCSATTRHHDDEFIIAATASSIHILKSSVSKPKITVLLEKQWESPITAVAISSCLYAVASVDNRVIVASFKGESYHFTFQSSLCLALSLSDTTLAAGFCDGSFILASLKDRGPIFTVSPFKAPVKAVSHVSDDVTTVEWCHAVGLVTAENIDWLKLPSFPPANLAAFGPGLLALGTAKSLDIYSFAERKLLAQIPQRVVGVCCSGRHVYALTIKNELIVLYYLKEISVDHQSMIDVDEPLAISAVDETVYVLCEKYVAVFDMRGHKLDTVEISYRPRFFDAASRGFFVVFARMIRYISRDQSTKQIPHDKGNLTGFSVIDDDRFVVTTSSRLMLCECQRDKTTFSTIDKLTQKVLAVKCYSSRMDNPIDTVMVVFEDNSIQKWPLPDNGR